MPDETTGKNTSGLPPKLTARGVRTAATSGVVPGPAPVAPVPQAVPGIKSDKKKETSKLALADARPAPSGLSEPVLQTVRLQKPAPAGVEKIGPLAVSPAQPAAGPEDVVTGIQSERKSDTSRIDLDVVIKPLEPVTSATAPSGVNTVRIKSGPTVQAFVGTQPIVLGGRPVQAAPAPAPAAGGQGAGGAQPDMGPATIKLKKPDGLRQGGETSRISLEGGASGAGAPAATPAAPAAPRTVRIKRPDEAAAQSSPVTGRKTLKITRPGQSADSHAAEAAAGDDQPLTQRRTLSIKHQDEVPVSDRSARLAKDEEDLNRQRGVLPPGEQKVERAVWAWCLVNFASMIIIGLVLWVFCVQLFPKDDRLKWPGRILSFNDAFFKDERSWL